MRATALSLALALALALVGCGSIRVYSQPPGAAVTVRLTPALGEKLLSAARLFVYFVLS